MGGGVNPEPELPETIDIYYTRSDVSGFSTTYNIILDEPLQQGYYPYASYYKYEISGSEYINKFVQWDYTEEETTHYSKNSSHSVNDGVDVFTIIKGPNDYSIDIPGKAIQN